jgi:hypothetical protein
MNEPHKAATQNLEGRLCPTQQKPPTQTLELLMSPLNGLVPVGNFSVSGFRRYVLYSLCILLIIQ